MNERLCSLHAFYHTTKRLSTNRKKNLNFLSENFLRTGSRMDLKNNKIVIKKGVCEAENSVPKHTEKLGKNLQKTVDKAVQCEYNPKHKRQRCL